MDNHSGFRWVGEFYGHGHEYRIRSLEVDSMSQNAGVLECQNGYKIRWKIDDFKFLHKSVSAYRNSPQIVESSHFKMWDCNWKFNLTLERNPCYTGMIMVNISLEILDVQSWDEKGLTISTSLKAIHKGGDEEEDIYPSDQRLMNYKIKHNDIFTFTKIPERILHDFEFIWNIWLVENDFFSVQYKRHVSNAKRIKLMANKWGLMMNDIATHDVKIQCGNVEMGAHKLVLSGSSSVFKTMLQAGLKESLESVVEVTGRPEVVQLMLRWIYTGEFVEDESKALELLKLAHYYDLNGLLEECQLFLEDTLCKFNAVEILNEADLLGAKGLKEAAIQYIFKNRSDFKDEQLEILNPKLLIQILKAQ